MSLSWDATSPDGQHINEVYVNLPSVPPLKEGITNITVSYAACFHHNQMKHH